MTLRLPIPDAGRSGRSRRPSAVPGALGIAGVLAALGLALPARRAAAQEGHEPGHGPPPAAATVTPTASAPRSGTAGAAVPSGAVAVVNPDAVARPAMRAMRASRPPAIDGRLDDAVWALATPVGDFVQQLPRTGAPATFRTQVRVLYDADNLYVAALNLDPEPHRAITAGLERDFASANSDAFGITLDTFLDRRNSFLFLVNPKGAVRDEQTFDDSRNIVEAWEGVITVRTGMTDSAWTVEMAIPLRTLRFDPRRPVQDWGVNFLRRVRRVNESSYWAPLDRQYRLHRMSRAGTLTGLEGLRPGRNLQVKPYVVGNRSRGTQVPATALGTRGDVGGDLKWGLTPSLTLDLTANTDFSQVEVDQEQVNLTRFSLLFPERREFFIENAATFTFGDVQERNYRMGASLRDFTLFNSRQIGLTRDGRTLPIVGGGRLTGRAGGWEVGLLDMQVGAAAGAAAENFGVARLRRRVGTSDVGALVANRAATDGSGGWNTSWGLDANLRPLGNVVVNSYLAGSAAPQGGSDGLAARTSVAYRDRMWNTSAMWRRVDAGFDPGIGFARRRGMEQWYATFGAHPRPRLRRIQEVHPYVDVDYITNGATRMDTRHLLAGVEVAFQPDGSLVVEGSDQFDRVAEAFTVFPGRQVPAGAYAWREGAVRYQSGTGRAVSGNVGVAGGGFYDGTRTTWSGGLAWRARHDLGLEATLQRNDVVLGSGAFTADLVGARLRYARSTTLFGSAFVQYNTQARAFITNARVNLRYRPLSDVFLVYTERRNIDTGVRNERSVALKVTRMLAL